MIKKTKFKTQKTALPSQFDTGNKDETSCLKCGKIITNHEADDFEGQCATCWHKRNS
jgi:hypothetical protein